MMIYDDCEHELTDFVFNTYRRRNSGQNDDDCWVALHRGSRTTRCEELQELGICVRRTR